MALTVAEDTADRDALVSLTAFACADAFVEVSSLVIQMHGGIAFAWEHPAHLYWRRASAGAQLFGASNFYREPYLTELEKAK